MPSIPRYQRRETIPARAPNAPRNPRAAGAGGAALADLADSAGGLAEVFVDERRQRERENMRLREDIGRIRNRLEKEEQHYSTLRLGNQVTESALNFETDRLALTEMDAFGSQEAVNEWEQQARDTFLKDQDDPDISRAVDAHISAKGLSLRRSLARHEAGQRDVVAENTRRSTLRTALKTAYMGNGTLDDNLVPYRVAILSDPRLGDGEKEDKIMAGESAIASARLEGMIDRNPSAAKELLDSGVFNEYLSAEALDKFQGRAEQAEARVERDRIAQEKFRIAKEKEALEQEREETGNEFFDALTNGTLTEDMIQKSNLHPTEGTNSKRGWTKALKDAAKGAGGSEAGKTDPVIEGDLTARILADPNNKDLDAEIVSKINNGLSGTTARTLTNFRKGLVDDPLKTDQAKTAIASLNAAKSAKVFDSDSVENVRRWGEATDLLKKFIVNHPEEDAAEFVDKLLEKERDGFIRRIFDFLPGVEPAETAEARRQRLAEEAGTRRAEPSAGEMEVPDDWMKRARNLNPDVSDEELRAYYQDKYGNR